MDRETTRRALIRHLENLRELGFVCVEGGPVPSAPPAPAAAPAPSAQPASARTAVPAKPDQADKPDNSGLAAPALPAAPAACPSPSADEFPRSLFCPPPGREFALRRDPLAASAPSRIATPLPPVIASPASSSAAPPPAEADTPDLFAEESSPAASAPPRATTPLPLPPPMPSTTLAIPAVSAELTPALPPEKRIEKLSQIAIEVARCDACRLCEGRTRVVPGQGSVRPPIVFVGEGPGQEEDLQGLAFVGRAGRLLTDIIRAMGLSREEVFIANVVKCRPPDNRAPEYDEMQACEPYLKRQLEILRPPVIVALGAVALRCLLRDPKLAISKVRGRWQRYESIPLMPTFHPAYLLRNPSGKREVWEDMKKVMEVFGLEPPPPRGK